MCASPLHTHIAKLPQTALPLYELDVCGGMKSRVGCFTGTHTWKDFAKARMGSAARCPQHSLGLAASGRNKLKSKKVAKARKSERQPGLNLRNYQESELLITTCKLPMLKV